MSLYFEPQKDLIKRKFPRLFLVGRPEDRIHERIDGLFVIWPDRLSGAVLDISESGILVSSRGLLSQVKIGQTLEIKIRYFENESPSIQVRVLRLTAGAILLSLEALALGGRLKITQDDRESIIRNSWRLQAPQVLPQGFSHSEMIWYHSAFDSNIWIWRDSAGVLTKTIVEFESVAFIYDQEGSRFVKTPSAFDEAKSYVGPLIEVLPNRVEPGINWRDRFLKCFKNASAIESFLEEFKGLTSRNLNKHINV